MPIRAATIDDLPALMPLLRAYCDFYEAQPSEAGLEAMLRDMIPRSETEAIVLVATGEGNDPVGFAACDWAWSSLRGARVVVLADLFVEPGARGAGHADALIGAVAEIARHHGAAAVAWFTATDNYRAHAVYDRVGGKAEELLEYSLEL